MSPRKNQITAGHYSIIPVTREDLDRIVQVYRQSEDFLKLSPSYDDASRVVQEDWEKAQASGSVYCGIQVRNGETIGVVDFNPAGYQGRSDQAYITLLMLTSGHRSLGIGSEILSSLEAEIRKDPAVREVWAHVQVNNPRALAFWQRNGYRVTGDEVENLDGTRVVPIVKKIQS